MSFHNVYEFVLSKLSLSPDHKANLLARGISEVDIARNGYKTWPYKRLEICQAAERKFGRASLLVVPGFWVDEGNNDRLMLSGVSGIAIPILSPEGKIQGIKLRPDNPASPTSKYVHLSSNPAPDKKTGEIKYTQGTAAIVNAHFPPRGERFAELTGRDIRVTEGELKADIATLLSDTYTISVPGVGLWEQAMPHLEKIKPGRLIISYDSDKNNQKSPYSDKPFEVGRALGEFYLSAKALGYTVVIEDWPASSGKGIDDVLASGKMDTVRFLSDAEAESFSKNTGAEATDQKGEWVYIIGVQRFVHKTTHQELTKDQYRDKFMVTSKKKDPVEVALKSAGFPRLDYPAYEPGDCNKILQLPNGTSAYNYWRGTALEHAEGDVKPFLDHVAYILPDPVEAGHLLDFLAWQVQHPGKKIHWALLLQGVQGTGKSYFGDFMKIILGEHNVSTPSNEEIHEPYTGWQKNCQLIIIEELMARGRLELMNKLKPMITQPVCRIREMHKPTYDLPNKFNFLMLTNHEDSIIIDAHDRRYCVLWSPAVPMPGEYYATLWEWTHANAGAILRFLSERDLAAFPAKGHAPQTAAKKNLVKMSATPLKAWIAEGIESESWPFMTDVITTAHLVECVPSYIRGANPNLIGRILNECGCKQLGQVRLSSGSRCMPWSIRRHETWAGCEKETLVHEIEKWSASKEPGGNPLMDARPI